MNNLAKISGGRTALKQAVEFKKYLLSKGYSDVDLCLDKEHELFAIACEDDADKESSRKASETNFLNLIAMPIGAEDKSIGHVVSEYKIAKYINDVFSCPTHMKLGIGKLLVSRTIDKLKDKKSIIDPIFLFVRPNCIVSNYYDQFGFEDFDKYDEANPNYKMIIKQMNVAFANKILTEDRFGLAKNKRFVADGHEIHTTLLAAKR